MLHPRGPREVTYLRISSERGHEPIGVGHKQRLSYHPLHRQVLTRGSEDRGLPVRGEIDSDWQAMPSASLIGRLHEFG
jgi:hypothetical protein